MSPKLFGKVVVMDEEKMIPINSSITMEKIVDIRKSIKKKVMRAVTDAGPTEMNQTPPEAIQNLFTLMEVMSSKDTLDFFKEQYANCTIRYGDLKKQLAEDVINFTSPLREKILEVTADTDYLRKARKLGADKARESASKTIKEVREIIGFKPF
jgi:tryptophanyl-tRNA synthetase